MTEKPNNQRLTLQFGLANHADEPGRIRKIHAQEVEFVQFWLDQWHNATRA
jgi:hypothetical protein